MNDLLETAADELNFKNNLSLIFLILYKLELEPQFETEEILSDLRYFERRDALVRIGQAIALEEIVLDKKTLYWWMENLFNFLSVDVITRIVITEKDHWMIKALKVFYKLDLSTELSDFELFLTSQLSGKDWGSDDSKIIIEKLHFYKRKLKEFIENQAVEH